MTSLSPSLSDHAGPDYLYVLQKIHAKLEPRTYLEIGTLEGRTLQLSSCPSIAIDPNFRIKQDVVGQKSSCHFYQMGSDDFFDNYKPHQILGKRVDLAFLDGMHQCEFLFRDFFNTESECHSASTIVMHDCLPVEVGMTAREQVNTSSSFEHRKGWWTGDVWRVLYALKAYRPELVVSCLDAQPTGLVVINKVDPDSRILKEKYQEIVDYMLGLDLNEITPKKLFEDMNVQSCTGHSLYRD